MSRFRRFAALGLLTCMLVGCSPDIREISDIALVMLTAIDYDEQKRDYVFTINCIDASTNDAQNSAKKLEWIASASGKTILEAARNLRSRAGKILVWQHDKFFLIGEGAARNSLYEVVDFLSRNRDIRLSGYLVVSQGTASDLMRIKSETGDLISNETVGRIKNEQLWGKSLSLTIKDVADYYGNPYRGFVTGKLSRSMPVAGDREVLFLSGGSVIHQGKLAGWLPGKDVLAIHLIIKKKYWRELEFPQTVPFRSAKISLLMRVANRSVRMRQTDGQPVFDVRIGLTGTVLTIDKQVNLANPDTLRELELAAGRFIEGELKASLNRFQQQLKIDVVGFSDIARKYHPQAWKRMEKTWSTAIYPTVPVRVHVDVSIPAIGMSKVLGGD
ncbi:Ger(x)C family spore germination protein [Paenibacillus glycinis]|uniref:Ger(X)C family spore germination protein n=1 Tax=Paenibacillus glycinis TaxID=2697035 RepID=A0ABW9XKY3_9BACL|nr:Ger(x)C family spore germination protein [Paenibacillus glycinis]NBD23208.1 Ger(x)C family spore germination protein [Paenibacillus glycinis]